MPNSKELLHELLSKITLPDREEASAIAYFLLEQRFGLKRSDIMVGKPIDTSDLLRQDIERINRHEPVQYITERAWFKNRLFIVKPGVLIPRPETELLVDEVIRAVQHPSSIIVDVGVGSGCISISLALALPRATITGVDISDIALSVARENVKQFKVAVELQKKDILSEPLPEGLDIIVSNPPYIPEQEKKNMEANVLDFEPPTALFVSDDDPLLFYGALAEQGMRALKPGGKLIAELNPNLSQDTASLLESFGYRQVMLIRDLEGKNRIVKATR